jgi:RimJ/RimL family protein N-acetyltransferase
MTILPEPIATERLVLQPISPETAQKVVDGDLSGVPAGDGWPHADTRDGLGMAVKLGHAPGWFVTLDGVVIGDAGLHGEPDEQGDVELGYGLAEPYRGQGYAREFVPALAEWLAQQIGVRRVVARGVEADNTPSRRALERAGFEVEREEGGQVWYARPV